MKAVAVFPGTQTFKIIEHEAPRLTQPDQVMLRMLDIGICGTDREICSFEYGTPPLGSDYLVIGHEALAEVAEVGSAVSRLKPGDLVVPTVRRPCSHPECLACRSGHQDYCYTGDFTERGIKEAHGYMTDFVVDAASSAVDWSRGTRCGAWTWIKCVGARRWACRVIRGDDAGLGWFQDLRLLT